MINILEKTQLLKDDAVREGCWRGSKMQLSEKYTEEILQAYSYCFKMYTDGTIIYLRLFRGRRWGHRWGRRWGHRWGHSCDDQSIL